MTHEMIDAAETAIREAMDNGGWNRTMGLLPDLIRLAHLGLSHELADGGDDGFEHNRVRNEFEGRFDPP
jgi:hypothetical protein